MNNQKVKILYLTLNPDLKGPIPKIDPLLIAALNDLGCQITRGTWGRHSDDENIIEKLFGRLGDIRKAVSILIQKRHDVLYVATTLDEPALARDIPLLIATHLLPVKKVLIEHGSKTAPLALPGTSLYKLLTRMLIRWSDAILVLSNEELHSWSDFEPRGKYYRIDNPFIPNNALGAEHLLSKVETQNEKHTLLFVGRLIKCKGIFDLLDAMPIILKQTDCHLLIAGDGAEKAEIQRRVDSAHLNRSVSLLGYIDSDRLSNVYQSSTIFILPTYCGEGYPTVIAEAMSFGIPIVTTALRGTSDHLQDGLNALFVPPRDPQAIAQAVLRLTNSPSLRVKMGQANMAKIQDFSPENVAPKYLKIFYEVLHTR